MMGLRWAVEACPKVCTLITLIALICHLVNEQFRYRCFSEYYCLINIIPILMPTLFNHIVWAREATAVRHECEQVGFIPRRDIILYTKITVVNPPRVKQEIKKRSNALQEYNVLWHILHMMSHPYLSSRKTYNTSQKIGHCLFRGGRGR